MHPYTQFSKTIPIKIQNVSKISDKSISIIFSQPQQQINVSR